MGLAPGGLLRRDIDPLINTGRRVLAALRLPDGRGLSPGPPGGAGTSQSLACSLSGPAAGTHPGPGALLAAASQTQGGYSFPGLPPCLARSLPQPEMLLQHWVLQEVFSF